MAGRILVTGGAGFIGSHLADELLTRGYQIRVLDSLIENVHGAERRRPAYLDHEVELVVGDVRDPAAVRRALVDVDAVFHFAARVGVAQSMHEVVEYTSVNATGTAVLLEALIARPVQRLIVASSMSVYGEGLYRDAAERTYELIQRSPEQLERGRWEPRSPNGDPLIPMPTPESKPPVLGSIYALTKFDQERMCLLAGSAHQIPTVALRFFNVYGPRQALSNPYTGVLAIFAARLLDGKRPLVFEDGQQRRDFVHVRDVARACREALEVESAAGHVFNIGSGTAITIREVASRLARVLDRDIAPEITGTYRAGDIRHCAADISLARRILGFNPICVFDDALAELAGWLATEQPTDRFEIMRSELEAQAF